MKRYRRLAYLACVMLPLLGAAAQAPAAEPVIGMDIPGVGHLDAADQDALLAQLRQAGVRVVRAWVLNQNGIDFITKAYAMGIKVELTIPLQYQPGAVKRGYDPDLPWVFPNYPLSAADPARTAAIFAANLRKLEAAGIVFVGFEVGNEQNNAAFNGDFAIHPPGTGGRNMGLADLQSDPEGQTIAAGFRQYIAVLQAVRAVRDQSSLNRATPLILGGLADWGDERPWTKPVDGVSINATIRSLRQFGLDSTIDAYGIHLYPNTDNPGDPEAATRRRNRLARTALAECQAGGAGKPCWITEWGFRNPDYGCPPDETDRTALVREAMADLRPYIAEGRVAGLFYYTWREDGTGRRPDPFSVFRCGSLTAPGQIAIDESLLR